MAKKKPAARARPRGPGSSSVSAGTLAEAGRLHNAGDWDGAERIYAEVLKREPEHARALFLSGLLAYQRGDFARARALLERAVSAADGVADYRVWLARVQHVLGEEQKALSQLCAARALGPPLTEAIVFEARLLRQTGQLKAAEQVLREALGRAAGDVNLLASLGEVFLQRGEFDAAVEQFLAALQRDPGLLAAWINLGVAHLRAGAHEAACAPLAHALQFAPESVAVHVNLAAALEARNAFDAAIAHYRRACQLEPDNGEWQLALAGLLSQVGETAQALALYRAGLPRAPNADAHSSFVALLQYVDTLEPAQRLTEARAWAHAHAPGSAPAARRVPARAARPLRVGYVSADFRQHSVSYFFAPLLAAHDPARVAVTCYSNGSAADEMTARVAARARFESIVGRSDAAVAEQIRADGIDVLVDLSGHTLGQRLGVFSLQPAPVQLTYLGYPGTTGVEAIRWRMTDSQLDPAPQAERYYSESLLRLPRTFCCFEPPPDVPEVSALPAAHGGRVTFGSLNTYVKLSDGVLRAWSRVLERVPDSRLILQSRVFADPACCERAWSRLERFDIARERVQLFGLMALRGHLALYAQIDLALDVFPWNGHTTSCLALHMGVPVVSLAAEPGGGRLGASVLNAVGLSDWVTHGVDDYVDCAVHHAQRLPALAALRGELRSQLARSPLCDAPSMARAIEDAYHHLEA